MTSLCPGDQQIWIYGIDFIAEISLSWYDLVQVNNVLYVEVFKPLMQ